jgi:hypothetical protein
MYINIFLGSCIKETVPTGRSFQNFHYLMKKLLFVLVLGALATISFAYVKKEPSPGLSKNLAFPVAGKKASIASFWGDVRDGGKRKHEGIDIFAKKGTPVVAICDGIVTSTGNTPRGGKTIWVQSLKHTWTAYYAHLDVQKVKVGQFVKKGQTIGTVGNTGNARTTPPHLHFGIYTWWGAVNPLPYVKNSPRVHLSSQAMVSQSAAVKKTVTENAPVTAKRQTSASLAAKYVWKTIYLTADPSSQYYVTTRLNVVRVHKDRLEVVGKWKKMSGAKYPYKITLANNQQLYITKGGKLLTANGAAIGNVS